MEEEKQQPTMKLIDDLPKLLCNQQHRRSPPSKRRTDFSTFLIHHHHHDTLLGSSSATDRDAFSTASTSTSLDWDDDGVKLIDLLNLQKCKKLLKFSNAEPVSRDTFLQSSNDASELSDKGASSLSSRTEGDLVEKVRRRSNRKRKPQSPEVTYPPNSENKYARRYKIMRYLSLAPPIGSPF
ncbi:hypothetical protein ACFE04_020581 [Oxalis oulophora]